MSHAGSRQRTLGELSGWNRLGHAGRVAQAGGAVLALCLLCMATVDKPVARFMHAQATGDIKAIWTFITQFGDATPYIYGALAVILVGRLARGGAVAGPLRGRLIGAERHATLLLAGLAVSGVILNVAKVAIGRLRPNYLIDQGLVGFQPFHFDFGANTFPSGHSQAIWAVAIALCIAWPRARIALCTVAASVAASRVVLVDHFVSDVIAGSALGIATVLLLRRPILSRADPARAILRGMWRGTWRGLGWPARWLRARRDGALSLLAATTVVLAVASVLLPEVDLWLMQVVHTGGNDFWLRHTAIGAAYDVGRDWVFNAIGLAILGLTGLALLGRPLPGFGGRRLGAIWITLVGVVGVLGNLVFKNGFGRPRPKDTEAFGGAWPFHPPWLPGGACPHNCSFPSGDVGFAFITLAFALAVPAGRGRTVAVAAALAFGGFVAAMRVLTGDHYPSDAAFGALMTSLAVLAFERWWVAPVAKSRSNRHRGVTGMS